MRNTTLLLLLVSMLPACVQGGPPATPPQTTAAAPPTAAATRFVAAEIPQIPERLRETIQSSYDRANSARYTLAVDTAGRGWAAHDGQGSWTAADRIRVSLQRCEHAAQGPCILVMEEGRLTGRTTAEPRALTYPTALDFAAIPFISDAARRSSMGRVLPHYAIAISRFGSIGFAAGWSSGPDAAEAALRFCRGGDSNRPCFVYSVNNQVMFTPETDISDAIRGRP